MAIVLALCWYFKNVIIYIIAAFVVSMIGRPLMQLMRRIRIKGKSAPNWLLAVLVILLIFFFIALIITQMIPLVSGIVRNASAIEASSYFDSNPIDNFIYQSLIYSTSIKAHPLEIFIVLLMAGHIASPVGMLVAITSYTVVRVVDIRFFYRYKIIQRLVPDLCEEDKIIENID